jgi:putative oxidoreductase
MSATIIGILLGLIFLLAGSTKVFAVQMQIESFQSLRLPQWFRLVTGLMQYVGVGIIIAGLWDSKWLVWAAAWFAIIMFFAVAAHVRVKHTFAKSVPAFVLLLISLLLLYLTV